MPYLLSFTVEGSGYFPFDMLRYDQCWPASQEDVNKLSGAFPAKDWFTVKRSVTLHTVSQFKKSEPTIERWRSFGWEVIKTQLTRL